jgi:hypothetical protein
MFFGFQSLFLFSVDAAAFHPLTTNRGKKQNQNNKKYLITWSATVAELIEH